MSARLSSVPPLTVALTAACAAVALGCGSSTQPAIHGHDAGADGTGGAALLWSARGAISDGYIETVWGDGTTILAAGLTPRISRSGDGGQSWITIEAGVTAAAGWPHIFHLAGSAAGDVWAVGSRSATQSLLLRSTDRGQTWKERPVPVLDHLQAVWSFDGINVLVASYDGGVARTADAGLTWSH